MAHYASLSHAECNAVHILREMADDKTRKAVKAQIFSRAKIAFGIPPEHKLVVETDVNVAGAGTLKNKATRETYLLSETTGKWVNAQNGSTKRWFRLSNDDLFGAVTEALDAVDGVGRDNITSQVEQPADIQMIVHPNSDQKVVVDTHGNLWVQMDADAYESTDTPDEEEEDDAAY
jgi:hypothetical protein